MVHKTPDGKKWRKLTLIEAKNMKEYGKGLAVAGVPLMIAPPIGVAFLASGAGAYASGRAYEEMLKRKEKKGKK